MNQRYAGLLSAAIAGCAATLPMTIVMTLWRKRLPWLEQGSLPPRKITEHLLDAVHVGQELSEPQKQTLTVVSHFGYGTAAGSVFGLMPRPASALGAVSSGMVFGLGVWTGSYLGWLPAVGLHRSATEEPAGRNLLMLTAHLVWGGSLGLLTHVLTRKSQGRNRQGEIIAENKPSHYAENFHETEMFIGGGGYRF